jgi:glycosyltransferase involved in cell wall biosynthesis
VLVNAGPWLPVPPRGYGGIEAVVATLIGELRRRGIRVTLASVGASTAPVDRLVHTFDDGQFAHLGGPYGAMTGIAHAHMLCVLDALRDDPSIELVHDHLEVVGPATLAALGRAAPPVLQTLHWDLGKHPDFYGRFDGRGRVAFNALSERQLARAPARLRAQVAATIPLAVRLGEHAFRPRKEGHVAIAARVTAVKGQDVAARVCARLGLPLVLAGPVGPFSSPAELARASGERCRRDDVAFYLERVRPWEARGPVRWVGALPGPRREELVGRARAVLMPVRWEEPGATAAIEALACGTPVVGFRRGALPEIVEHGVTGFLADDDDEDELEGYLRRLGELDPHACRRAAHERFSAERMAARYVALYEELIARTATPPASAERAIAHASR